MHVCAYCALKHDLACTITDEARQMLEVLNQDPRAAHQFLLLAHLYARTDTYSLSWLRSVLVKSK